MRPSEPQRARSCTPHARVANIARAVERLQEVGFWVVGLEGSRTSIYDDPCPGGRVAIVIGSEERASRASSGSAATGSSSLPMRGRIGSLNASASLAAALYAFVLPSSTHA